MNLKYVSSRKDKHVITRLIGVITKYWHEKDKVKALFYAKRLVETLSNPL
jgi:hypothetical protein